MKINIKKFRSDDVSNNFALTLKQNFFATDNAIEKTVDDILRTIQEEGDAALMRYTHHFDHLDVDSMGGLAVSQNILDEALQSLPRAQREALETAASRIKHYHEKQKEYCGSQSWQYTEADGTVLGQKITPLESVGIYVPGGKASYPSSVLMNAIPASVAGVSRIIMVVPTPYGHRNPLVLAAAKVAGVHQVFTIGGAQAIGALAYGTATIPAVDKIVGPGNAYVASAKRRVFGTVGIDMIAGPSEILVITDGTANPDWIAMDLFSQAEHDEEAKALLLCPDSAFIDKVEASMARLIETMPRREIIQASLEKHGMLIQVKDMDEACSIANILAAEHLEIATENPEQWAEKIQNAGAIFLGHYSSESLGDYSAGPNHVLPTSGTARFSSALGIYDFLKRSSIIKATPQSAHSLGKIAAELADGEGLPAHAASARYRMDSTS